jgi:hypothetical protein
VAHDTLSRSRARFRLAVLAASTMLAVLNTTAASAASDVADAFAHAGEGRTASRSVALADLGIREAVVLHAPDARQELYLPVPAGIAISDASLQLDGGYLRGDGGRTSMLMSLDGSPVLARQFTQPQGDATASIGVDGAPRANGFVRVGLQWSSVISDNVCTDQTAIGNVLRVMPTTRLSYRFDPAAVTDLRTAWSALPLAAVVMIGARKLAAPAFDTGWRIEAQLQRDGRTPVTQAWPVTGDTVDLTGIDVPAPLRGIPAFAALAAGGSHKLANPAEAGALVVLTPRAFAPDVIVADDTLRTNVKTSLDALRAQVVSVSADAGVAFDAWRARAAAPIENPLAAGEARLAHLAGQAAIVVGDNASVSALAPTWRPIDVTNRIVVYRIDGAPHAHADEVALAALGGEPRTLDVLGRATWDVNFDLGAVSGEGKLPSEVVLDVAAAPTANTIGQTASLYFNDVLIGAQLLHTDGKPQRITAHVPRYALAATNLLRVVFQRQPDAGCQAHSQGHPVAVLPSSHLTLKEARVDDDFTGLVARFASEANVVVPAAYLDDATVSLPRLARLANAAGIAPSRGKLAVAEGDTATPKGPFLAADVALKDEAGRAKLSQDRLTLTDVSNKVLVDVSGLTNLAVIQAVKSGSTPGIVYRSVGATAPVLPATLQLSRGDVALVSGSGVLKVFDTLHPGEVLPADEDGAWITQRWLRWGVPGVLVALFLLLLFIAGRARRRHQDKS